MRIHTLYAYTHTTDKDCVAMRETDTHYAMCVIGYLAGARVRPPAIVSDGPRRLRNRQQLRRGAGEIRGGRA